MIELKTKSVALTELRPGSILCGDDGVPFAVVRALTNGEDGSRTAETRCIPPGEFDVRGFSTDHRYMRTHGATGITVLPSYPHAVQWCARDMAQRTPDEINIWRAYSAVYHHDVIRPARVSEFEPFMPVVFPAGTEARVVDCG